MGVLTGPRFAISRCNTTLSQVNTVDKLLSYPPTVLQKCLVYSHPVTTLQSHVRGPLSKFEATKSCMTSCPGKVNRQWHNVVKIQSTD